MKEKLLILVMLFVLSACSNSDSNSNNDVVEADLEKWTMTSLNLVNWTRVKLFNQALVLPLKEK